MEKVQNSRHVLSDLLSCVEQSPPRKRRDRLPFRYQRADARLDSAFGLVLYAPAIIEEIGFHRIQTRIVGKFALRALVEANITLRYVIHKDDDELWKSYRVYGAGQANGTPETFELSGIGCCAQRVVDRRAWRALRCRLRRTAHCTPSSMP